jgi:phenylalanyl-tRNA synthetase beta chain
MKISYNWLKEYIDIQLTPGKTAEILTDIGLEVEGIEQFETVKGGLEGVVVGEVKQVLPHPDADRLQLTKIDVGHSELLDIVCGAPNVAEGQKVVVALVGSTLYAEEKGFKIKKSKIRGEVSEGMLCAEDELGLGESHDGIMVLDQKAKAGMPASEYFQLESDTVFEIGLTPNRIDAASHFGVARDLAAYFSQEEEVKLKKPKGINLSNATNNLKIEVEVKDEEACPRYSGITISNLKVKTSPDWLQNRLKAVGLKPINNVVDVTNFVMQEIGQPLHAFDANEIKGGKVVVQTLKEGTTFTTLDEVERKLSGDDLMICDNQEGMCIAGVFGGIKSGVTESTKAIFLESAYFNPVYIRKTAKRHGLNTDASFRYERGADPNITIFALQRAAQLLQEIAGGELSSVVFDHYPKPIEDFLVELDYRNCDRLIGKHIDRKQIKKILSGLDIKILHETKEGLRLQVPAYRVDVQREVDIIEEVLRIYGYNRIPLPEQMKSSMLTHPKKDATKVENTIADFLSSNGFNEVFNNSLTNPSFYPEQTDLVQMLNPLSKETEVMRKSMLYGGLEAIAYNQNRRRKNLKFYEFGKTYRKLENTFEETKHLAIWMSGDIQSESWQEKSQAVDFYDLKTCAIRAIERLGITKWKAQTVEAQLPFALEMNFLKGKKVLARLGKVSSKELKKFDIKENVFYVEFNWTLVLNILKLSPVKHQPVSKFPSVRRDLALLLDENIQFSQIEEVAKSTERKFLKSMNLFDVYEGKNLAEGKKSYAVSFMFQDEQKTLTDKQIDKVMDRLIQALTETLSAELR